MIMYENHELEIIQYERNVFVVASENLGEGEVEGPDLPIDFS